MSLISQALAENRRTLALAVPMIVGFLGQMLMGWADTIMVAQTGVIPLAACAFANTVLAVPMVFGFGLLSSVSVRTSYAFGADKPTECGEALRGGLLISLVVGLLVAGGIQLGIPLLPVLGQKPEVNEACVAFLILVGWSILPVFLTTSMKNFSEALARPWPPFWIMMASVLLNIVLNWVLIYGNLGAPALGLEGAGWATLIARIAATVAMFIYLELTPRLRHSLPVKWLSGGFVPHVKKLLGIGLPTGGMHLSEVTGFAFASIMMGWLSVDGLAAHQIAITCAATAFMIPLGLSQATSVRVGQARGRGEISRCRSIIFGALGLTMAIMVVCALVFLFAGRRIALLFVDDGSVVILATQLLLMAGFFQIFDGVQIVSSGALRGFEDTKVPLVIGVISYWVVGMPVAYYSSFILKIGPQGVWFGLVCGLFAAAVALSGRLLVRLHRLNV